MINVVEVDPVLIKIVAPSNWDPWSLMAFQLAVKTIEADGFVPIEEVFAHAVIEYKPITNTHTNNRSDVVSALIAYDNDQLQNYLAWPDAVVLWSRFSGLTPDGKRFMEVAGYYGAIQAIEDKDVE